MLALLKRWLGWDSSSSPFDFSDLTPPAAQRPPAQRPAAPPGAQKKAPQKPGPATPPARAAAAAKAAKPAAAAPAKAPGPAKPAKPAKRKEPIDALHNPSLTLDKPSEDGFDPYNTGAFNRSTSWERISRHKR